MILDSAETVMEVIMQIIEEEGVLEFLQSPEAIAVAAPLALIAATPPPLPTFVPQGTPPPTAGGSIGGGGGGTGGSAGGGGTGGSGAGATGGGILPGVALAVSVTYSNTKYDYYHNRFLLHHC